MKGFDEAMNTAIHLYDMISIVELFKATLTKVGQRGGFTPSWR